MIKRKLLFKLDTFKNKINADKEMTIIILLWIIFVIACSTFAFILAKKEPITLTQYEIKYYTTQAELAYNEGIFYLDNTVEFINNHDGSFDVYSYNQPEYKQKLNITFLEDGQIDTNLYYSYNFTLNRLGAAFVIGSSGFIIYLPLVYIILCIYQYFYKPTSKKQE